MFARSMTPNQLLARHNFAVVRVDENGEYLWYTNSYPLEGSALSDVEENNQYVSNGDRYEVVEIDHDSHCDGECADMQDAIDSANAALNRARETVADVETMLDDLRAECDRLRADNDRYDTAFAVVVRSIANECDLICRAHRDDADYCITKRDRRIRDIDRKRYETLARIHELIASATNDDYGAILPPFPQLS